MEQIGKKWGRAGVFCYTLFCICLLWCCVLIFLAGDSDHAVLPILAIAAVGARLFIPGILAARYRLVIRVAAMTIALLASFMASGVIAAVAIFFLIYALLDTGQPARCEVGFSVIQTGLIAFTTAAVVQLLPEVRTFDSGTLLVTLLLWSAIPLLLFGVALLLRWARPPRTAGLLLLLVAPVAFAFTSSRLLGLTEPNSVIQAVQAFEAILPPGAYPRDLAAGTESVLLTNPSLGVVLLLQLGLLGPILLVHGLAIGALGALPRPVFGVMALVVGLALGPLLPWWTLAVGAPTLGLLALMIGKERELPSAAKYVMAFLLAAAILAGGILSISPPRMAAPLARYGGRLPVDCWAGRLGKPVGEGPVFLDGLPLELTPGQQQLLGKISPQAAGGIALLPPGMQAWRSWRRGSLLGSMSPHELITSTGDLLVVIPDPRHRQLATLLSPSFLTRLDGRKGVSRLVLRLDRLTPAETAIFCQRLGGKAQLSIGLEGLVPPLLMAVYGKTDTVVEPGWRLIARPAGLAVIAETAPLRPLDPLVFCIAPRPGPTLSGNLIRMADLMSPKSGEDRVTKALMLAMAARWDPKRSDAGDLLAPLIPTITELDTLEQAATGDNDPQLLDYMAMAGGGLLHPKVQLLETARPYLDKWQHRFPDHLEFTLLLGTLRVRLLEFKAALPLLRKVHDRRPGNRVVCRELGLAHYGLLEYEPAAQWLNTAKPDPRLDPEGARARALAMHHTGRPEARKLLLDLMAITPLDAEVKQALKQK